MTVGNNAVDVLLVTLSKIDLKKNEILTLYYGAETQLTEAEQAATTIRSEYSHLQVEIIKGTQPYYNYIVSIE